jgi:hypothetical protein
MINKKELKEEYKRTLQKMGIYQVKNLINGKIFIGRGLNVNGKLNSTKFQLEHGSYVVHELQNEYNQFGAENFTFEVIDYLEPREEPDYDYSDDLKILEEMWLEKLQPFDDKGYNKFKP